MTRTLGENDLSAAAITASFHEVVDSEVATAVERTQTATTLSAARGYFNTLDAKLKNSDPSLEVAAARYVLSEIDQDEAAKQMVAGEDVVGTAIENAIGRLRTVFDTLQPGALVVHTAAKAHNGTHSPELSVQAKVLEAQVSAEFGYEGEDDVVSKSIAKDADRLLPYPDKPWRNNYKAATLLEAAINPGDVTESEGSTPELLIGLDTVLAYAEQIEGVQAERLYVALQQVGVNLAETLPLQYRVVAQEIERQEIFDAELDNLADQMADHLELAGPEAALEVIEGGDYNELTQRLLRMAPDSIVSRPDAAQDVYSLFQHRVGEVLAQRAHAEAKRLSTIQDIARAAFRKINIESSRR